MPRLRLLHFVIVKSPGLLPMYFKVSELAETLCVLDITLREGDAYCVHCNESVAMNDISIHPRHGKSIMLYGKYPTWAAENRVETWLPGIMKK